MSRFIALFVLLLIPACATKQDADSLIQKDLERIMRNCQGRDPAFSEFEDLLALHSDDYPLVIRRHCRLHPTATKSFKNAPFKLGNDKLQ
jgi:hypothetical protein